jgi:hypothetical protein
MAVHRRPLVEGPPVELVVFRGDDWISDDGVPPLERWHIARFVWAKAHPNDFRLGGDVLDMLRQRAAYRRGCCRDPYPVVGFRPSRLCGVVRLRRFRRTILPLLGFERLTEMLDTSRQASMPWQPLAPS